MQERYVWLALGLAGGLLSASVVAVALNGPGWPYFLGLGIVALVAALLMGRASRQDGQEGAP